MRILSNQQKRRGAQAVEFAVICPVLLMLLLGVFEFCRYMMVRQLTENAVREGSRYAVARTDTFQTNVDATIIRAWVTSYLSQAGINLNNINIDVYKANQAGQALDINGNVVANKTLAATFDQTKFGEYICVSLTGDYNPVLPSFLNLAPTLTVTATAIMCSEGN